MQCMKCGRDLTAGEVFCDECRKTMEKYPVKPGTVVQLPHRVTESAVKKQPPRRRTLSPEDQLVLLKRMARKIALALVLSILLCAGLGYLAITQLLDNKEKQAPGQNYHAAVSATTAPVSTEAENDHE